MRSPPCPDLRRRHRRMRDQSRDRPAAADPDVRSAGDSDRQADRTPKSASRWASTTTRSCSSYVNRVGQRLAQAAHRPNLPWTFTVVDEAGRQRVCAAGRLHLPHARHPAVPARRSRAGRRARARSRARGRAPLGRAVLEAAARRRRTAGRGGPRARVRRPASAPAAGSRRRRSCQVRPRRRARVRSARRRLRGGERLGAARDAGAARHARRGSTRRRARAAACRTGRSRIRPPPIASTKIQETIAAAQDAGGAGDQPRRVRARPRRPRVRRQPREGHRARQRVPASDPALRAALPGTAGRSPTAPSRSSARRERRRQRRDAARARAQRRLRRADGAHDDGEGGAAGSRRRAHAHQRPRRLRRHLRRRDRATRASACAPRYIRAGQQTYLVAGSGAGQRFSRGARSVRDGDPVVPRALGARRPIAFSPAASISYVARPGDTWESHRQAVRRRREGLDARDHERSAIRAPTPRAGDRVRIVAGG